MSNGYLTGCALIISLLITLMFSLKKSVKNIETKIFKKMLICNIFESCTTTFIVVIALTSNSTFILKLLNRIDVILIILWCSYMLLYIYYISVRDIDKRIKKSVWFLNFIILVFTLILDVNIINENGILNSDGPLTYLGFIGATIYIISIIIVLFYFKDKNDKIDKNKYIPLYFLIGMLIIVAILRLIVPEINLISIILSLVDMIMIFTIENPDIKMLNEVTLAKNQAEKSNRVKSEFLSSMSHEIRTPLNAIVGFSQLIEDAESLEEAKENAKDMIEASSNLLNMISNVIDISQIEANNIEIEKINYQPEKEFRNVINLFKEKAENKQLDLDIEINDMPPNLIGDINKIKRILANLLDNAIKYTKIGYISIIINGEIQNKVFKLNIVVKDTGKGIDEKTKRNLFQNFVRSEEYKDSNVSGMGLGLSITKSLVELMSGKIICESKLNEGTKFTVYLEQEIGEQE